MGSISAYLRRNVLGLVAIFLALNAGAYAITSEDAVAPRVIPNKELRTGSVDSRVLATNAVTTPDIAPRTVGPNKIKLKNLAKSLRGTGAFGSGTITGISTSGGLTGGGDSGDVALGVDPSILQSRVSGTCNANEAVQSVAENGDVACGAIGASGPAGGDLTGSYPNPDLGNGVVGSQEVDPSEIQRRVTGTCAGNNAIEAINANGTVSCDTITANGSAGGDLTGNYPNPSLGNGVVGAANIATLPGVRVIQAPPCQTVPNAGTHDLRFDQVAFANSFTIDNPNDTVTVGVGGTYLVTLYAEWDQNGTGDRAVVLNSTEPGTSAFDARNATPQSTQGQTAIGVVHLPAGTTLSAQAGQGSGADLSLVDFGATCASLTAQWLGP